MANAGRIRRITFNTGKILERGRKAVSSALDEVSARMTEAILDKITAKKYPPASRAGQYPAWRTGNLAAKTRVMRNGRTLWVRTTQYGTYLQSGTRKMAARRFYREVLFEGGGNRLKKNWVRRINAAIKRNARKR